MSDLLLPSCWDRADGGFTFDAGTPATAVSFVGINYVDGTLSLQDIADYFGGNDSLFNVLEESTDSPSLEFSDQCTIQHSWIADYWTTRYIQTQYARGYQMVDSFDNVSRVLATNASVIPKTMGLLWKVSVTSEAQSFANPPEEFDIQTVEFNPSAEKHPRYSDLTFFGRQIVRNAEVTDNPDAQTTYQNLVSTLPTGSNSSYPFHGNQRGEALELLFKKSKGEDSFYLSGFKIIYSRYYWGPQPINMGGYTENPFDFIPSQYWTDQTTEKNIFAEVAGNNKNLYPNPAGLDQFPFGLSWLRYADVQQLNRTWYKVTSTWMALPLGIWDPQWYSTELQTLQTGSLQGAIYLGT